MSGRTRWRPDTCEGQGCILEYANEDPDHTLTYIQRCPAHAAVNAVALHAENRAKNHAVAAVVAAFPHVSPGDVRFRFSPGRELVLSHPGLLPNEKQLAAAAASSSAGRPVRFE